MIAFLDIETGGFSITKNGVCEIAIIATDLDLKPVAEFHVLIHPYLRPDSHELVSYKDDAMAINGLTVDKLYSEGIAVDVAMRQLEAFCFEHQFQTIIGHNIPSFDLPRVNYLLDRFSRATLSIPEVKCTMKMARERYSHLASHKQVDLCAMLNISNPNAHSAKGDCYANIELYKILTR